MNEQEMCGRAIARLVTRGGKERPAVSLPAQDAPVLTELGNELLVGYVVDQGSRFQYVQRRHLLAERMTEAELHRNAVANLALLLNDRGAEVHPCADGFVAAVPNRNILAFCDLKTPEGPLQLRRIIQSVGTGDHPISTALYYRDLTLRNWRVYLDLASVPG